MPRQLLYTICLCVLICDPADADSYAEFEDVLEIDRTHCFFVIATRCEIPNVRQVEIIARRIANDPRYSFSWAVLKKESLSR